MSGIDPLAAMSARVAAAEAAMLEAAINLGVSTEVLQAQISVGDILAAKILPPQNGQDLIEILGQRVSAQLPPGVHPGETLLLQVTGFAGTQIYVRNLGIPDPRNPLPVLDVVLTAPENGESAAPQPAPLRAPPQEPTQPPVSPPRAVFVAASVRPSAVSPTSPPAQSELPVQPTRVQGVEARIAASQAAKVSVQERPDLSPRIPPRTPNVEATVVRAAASAAQAAGNAAQRVVRTVSDFLRAARLPDTPFTRMAATIAPQAPERLPSVLQRLETALPKQPVDPRISTLRTLIGFTARLNPANPETLPAQISAYVSNVIEGVEAKLAQLLSAHAQTTSEHASKTPAAAQTAVHAPAPAQRSAVPAQAVQSNPVEGASDDTPALPQTLANARVAERAAAVSHDLKSVVLSLLRDPPADRTPAMSQALSEALITLTGVQVNALSSAQQNPGTFNITLPVYYREGGKPAQIRISSDAESRAAKLDADNFHVAFVLDTAHLGTVAIDLQTMGRTVKVDVKTENAPAAQRFSDTLDSLRGRLEQLRYRVASAVAGALPRASSSTATLQTKRTDARGVDLRA